MHGDSYETAEQHARALAETGPRYLSAYNDPDVIAGQAVTPRHPMAPLAYTLTTTRV